MLSWKRPSHQQSFCVGSEIFQPASHTSWISITTRTHANRRAHAHTQTLSWLANCLIKSGCFITKWFWWLPKKKSLYTARYLSRKNRAWVEKRIQFVNIWFQNSLLWMKSNTKSTILRLMLEKLHIKFEWKMEDREISTWLVLNILRTFPSWYLAAGIKVTVRVLLSPNLTLSLSWADCFFNLFLCTSSTLQRS